MAGQLFQPGNPGGSRPKGARNRLARKFLEDCLADWQEHGAKAISIMRRENPTKYCLMMASIVPRELEISTSVVTELDDQELMQLIDALRQQLRGAVIELPAESTKLIEQKEAERVVN
jgi:hypothetical protein